MNRKALIIGIVAVVAIAIAVFFLMDIGGDDADTTVDTPQTSAPNNNESSNNTSNNQNTDDGSEETDASTTITYTDSGFSPASLTVKKGTTVTVKNNSSGNLEFSSDVHPVHSDNPELNTASIGPGGSTTFTPNTTGTWGYHNHQKDSDRGTLIVQ